VSSRVIIRPAVKEDLEAISRLRVEAILGSPARDYSSSELRQWANVQPGDRTLERILDGCVLVGQCGRQIVGSNSLDLDAAEMVGLFVSPAFQRQGLGERLVTEIERLAIQFGLQELKVEAALPAIPFYRACRYEARTGARPHKDPRTRLDSLSMSRAFPRRQTRYGARIRNLLKQSGIPGDYGRRHRLRLQPECRELATIGNDIHGREQMLTPTAAMAWYAMRNGARDDGVELQIASAFRSVGYQVSIIERKRQAGQAIEDILKVSAAPGYSEHHTGLAVDISTPASAPLETEFEMTPAFEWLAESADGFGFRLSYPRNNRHGIVYEPWHWAFSG